jgi:putative hydrolase of the HAD superfamily
MRANEEPTRDKTELIATRSPLLDMQAPQALAFEASPSGASAAKRAGVACAAVPNRITRGATFDGVDVVLSSLAERSLDEILRMVSGPYA